MQVDEDEIYWRHRKEDEELEWSHDSARLIAQLTQCFCEYIFSLDLCLLFFNVNMKGNTHCKKLQAVSVKYYLNAFIGRYFSEYGDIVSYTLLSTINRD